MLNGPASDRGRQATPDSAGRHVGFGASRVPGMLVTALTVAAFLVGFAGVRALVPEHSPLRPSGPSSTLTPSLSAPAAPFAGAVVAVDATSAISPCDPDTSEPATRLVDGDTATGWTCPSNSQITFGFGGPTNVVGVRVTPGNSWTTELRWTFDDGTYVVQPLSAAVRSQEVRFPSVSTSGATLTIESTSEGGGGAAIAAVTFLSPA